MISKFQFFYLISVSLIWASAAPASPIPCKPGLNVTNCGIHVFRVALSSRPEEQGAIVEVKPRRKYGKNVYAPRGSADSFVIREIVDAIPGDVDPKVRDRIKDADFVMRPEENYNPQQQPIVLEGRDPIPANFHKPQASSPPQVMSSSTGDLFPPIRDNKSTFFIVLLVVLGVIVGILVSFLSYVLYACSRKPIIDRSNTVTYRKLTEMERKQREAQQRLLEQRQQKRYPMVRMSSGQSSTCDFTLSRKLHGNSHASLRTIGAVPQTRPARRDNLSLATSRDSREPLME